MWKMNLYFITILILSIGIFPKSIHCELSILIREWMEEDSPAKKMTLDDYIRTFHTLPDEAIKYDFLRIGNDTFREGREVSFNINGKEYKLNLFPSDLSESVIDTGTPIWEIKTEYDAKGQPIPYNYHKIIDTDKRFSSLRILEDKMKMAIIMVHLRGDVAYYDGVFGEGKDKKIIKSAPASLVRDYGIGYHFIYEYAMPDAFDTFLYEEQEKTIGTQPAINHFFTKFLVLVDYSLYKKLDENLLESIKFITIFWNAVDLKYRRFWKPKVSIKVTGIIIAQDETALSYVNSSRIEDHMGTKFINTRIILDNAKQYFDRKFKQATNFRNFDSALTMISTRDIHNIAGQAFLGGICSARSHVIKVRESGNYFGVDIAAHEIAHALNARHDTDVNCPEYPSFKMKTIMMKQEDRSMDKYIWSDCTLKAVEEFSRNPASFCLAHRTRDRYKEFPQL